MWEQAETTAPDFGSHVPLSDKLRLEQQIERQAEEIKAQLNGFPTRCSERERWRERLLAKTREMAAQLGLRDDGLDWFFTSAGVDVTRQFIGEAKAFDAGMKDEDLFQALRNLWVMHSIQALLDREVTFSSAAFGYSMLYPWTDNYLDGGISSRAKLGFGDWLELRLCGSNATPSDRHAAQVDRLLARIERVFPRAEFKEVHLSLRAIHQAQMASLRQQRSGEPLTRDELLQITVRKGGASVLADAYLVSGNLSEPEADFMFGYGVLLQLMDDLQDFDRDRANGHETLFVRQAMSGALDGLTRRLWSFLYSVLWSSNAFRAPRFQPIKALIQQSCRLLLLSSVARNHKFYSAGFAAETEACSPFRFDFIRTRGASLAVGFRKVSSLLRRRRRITSVFDLLA